MRIHHAWSSPAFDLPSVAGSVGPFAAASFLRAVTEFGDEPFHIVEGTDGLWVLAEEAGTVRMAGDADLTDYHTPLGAGADRVLSEYVSGLPGGVSIELDSLPLEAAECAAKGLQAAGVDAVTDSHTVTAVLDLPDSFDGYLIDLGKKQRHEVRRKRRRYEESVGALCRERHVGTGWGLSEFVRLHRLADGDKGDFMTDERVEFFRTLAEQPGWVVDLLRHPGTGHATACVFAHVGEDYALYNSSYDPELAEASPGVALLGAVIEAAIDEGCRRFDFLKGDETYKFRMGATERPLYTVTGRT